MMKKVKKLQRNLVINSIQAKYVLYGIYNEVSLYKKKISP